MIHQTHDKLYVISSHRVWMPGVYDTIKTARYAFQFCDEVLQALQSEANERETGGVGGTITMADLKRVRKDGVG